MLNFLGPFKKSSAATSQNSQPPAGEEAAATKASSSIEKANDEVKRKEEQGNATSTSSLLNGDVLARKITEIRSEVLGAKRSSSVEEAKAGLGGELPPPGKTELEELQEEASKVANESLQSTRRMAEYCEHAKDAGIKIIVALDDQKEQLDRIQDSLTLMREDLIQADSNIRGMEKCCGIFNNPFKKSNFKENENLWRDAGDGVVMDNSTTTNRPFAPTLSWPLNKSSGNSSNQHHSHSGNSPGGFMPGGYISKITEDKEEEEMEKNMGMISSMLGNLRNMAIDMNTEIENQNKQMNIINDMTDQNNSRIDDAIKRTHDLKR